jgi:hypothetical protein
MVHTILIIGHALCGTIALLVGCFALRPPAGRGGIAFRVYGLALGGMVSLVIAVVAADWSRLQTGQRVTFSLLCLLGVYTGWRGYRAWRESVRRSRGWQSRYIDNVGFTLISLFDGFAIVAAIDLGAPLPVVIGVGVLGVAAGIWAISVARSRIGITTAGRRSGSS